MNLSEILRKAKTLLSGVKLSQETLEDGTVIEFDGEIKEGTIVYVQSSTGDWIAIADGSYKTKSGIEFTVANGTVSAVKAPESPTEETKQEETKKEEKHADSPTVNVDTVATIDIQKLVEEKLQPLWQAIYDIKTMIEAEKSLTQNTQQSLSKVIESIETIAPTVEKLAKEPAAKAVEEKEVDGIKKVDKKIEQSRAYKIFNPTKN